MGRGLPVLTLFVALFCVAQGLRCNFCKAVHKNHTTCDPSEIEDQECSLGLSYCIKITMNEPAYGQVLRCASESECEGRVHHLVDRKCCDTDLCN